MSCAGLRGVRTDLHVAEGDLPVHLPAVVPGHEVVGEVVGTGDGATGFAVGDRVGVAWLRHTCGRCRFCLRGWENLCPRSEHTGWDADGGYAEFTTVAADFALGLPGGYSDTELAPLLCGASSATTPCCAPRSLRVEPLACTSSAPAPTSPPRFQERQVRSVTSNTRAQAREFLAVAGTPPAGGDVPYRLDQADEALADLAADRVHGAAVLVS